MGRPREPIELLQAKGNSHKTKAEIEERKESEIKVDKLTTTPKAPSHLNKNQKKIYKQVCRQLINIDLLTVLDIDTVVQYAISYDLYTELTKMINNDIQLLLDSKIVTQQIKMLEQCRKCANSLCMNISSRAKIVIPQNNKPKEKEDKFSKFVKKSSDAK